MTGARIDAHHHVWDLGVRDQPWITDELAPLRRDFGMRDLAPELAGQAIGATVVVQTGSVAAETRELLVLSAEDDVVAGVVGWVELTAADVGEQLAVLREAPGGAHLVGIRHAVQAEPDPDWLTRADVRRGLGAVADAGLAYDLLTLPHQLPAAIRTAAALPEARFVLDHLGKPPIASGRREPWASAIRELARHENVSCKLSGMVTEADWADWSISDLRPYADVVLEAFGPGRVLFGSDWPVCTLAATYAEVHAAADALTADLSDAERAAVFGGAARVAYRL